MSRLRKGLLVGVAAVGTWAVVVTRNNRREFHAWHDPIQRAMDEAATKLPTGYNVRGG